MYVLLTYRLLLLIAIRIPRLNITFANSEISYTACGLNPVLMYKCDLYIVWGLISVYVGALL
jgi:hypothetical protein